MDNSSQLPPSAPLMSVEELNAAIPAATAEPVFPEAEVPAAAPLPEIDLANEVVQGAAQVKDYLMQPAAGGPSMAPAPVAAPVEVPVASKKPQVSEEFKKATTPTTLELEQSLVTQAAPVRKMIADTTAKNLVNAELSKFIKDEQQRQQEITAQVQKLEEKTDNEVRAKSFAEIIQNGSFGQKILGVLAVGLGAVAKATGSADNPALRVIDQQIERQAQKDKLNFEQKLALKKQLIESSQNIIQAAQGRFTNENTQQQLQLQYDKLNAEREKVQAELKASFADSASADMLLESQLPFNSPAQGTPEEIRAIEANNAVFRRNIINLNRRDPKAAQKILEKVIVLPNKKIKTSRAAVGQVNKFNEVRSDAESAKAIISDIRAATLRGSFTDLVERERIKTNLSILTGRLRPSILGPGAMTQQEYDRLYAAIGDPTKIFSLNAIELAKLDAVNDNLDIDLREKARSMVGIDEWPLTKRQTLMIQFRARGASPREASERANKLLQKMGGG